MDTKSRSTGFEERLLAALKEEVAAAPRPVAAGRQRVVVWPARRRLVLAAGAAAALALGAVVTLSGVLGVGDRPAYAVESDPDGSIRIHIWEYSDPDGLEDRLRVLGVDAVVDYLPNGMTCQEPRATYVPYDQVPAGLFTSEPPEDGEDTYWRLHPDLIEPGQTLVFTTWLFGDFDPDGVAVSHTELATGPVAPCELVPGGPEVGSGPDGGIGG